MDRSLEQWAPRVLSVMRLVIGLLFLEHGTAKLIAFPHVAMFDKLPIASLIGAAGIIELVGGALIAIGLLTRPVAFILSGEMAIAYFKVHAPQDFFPLINQGELAVVYCFVFLYLAVAGGGAWSIDRMMGGRAR